MKPATVTKYLWASLTVGAVLALAACNPPPDPMDPRVANGAAAEPAAGDAGPPAQASVKPAAPVDVDYRVIGTPAVGRPTEIEVVFRSSESNAPVRADFHIADPAALSFVELPPAAAPIAMTRSRGGSAGVYRLRVVPQQAGRQVINVLAEIDTEIGQLSRSVAIPLDVPAQDAGAKRQSETRQSPEPQLRVDSQGEAIISMPARESRD